jgi:hypothetical protein
MEKFANSPRIREVVVKVFLLTGGKRRREKRTLERRSCLAIAGEGGSSLPARVLLVAFELILVDLQ